MSQGYCITQSQIPLRIVIVDVSNTHIHEETFASVADRLAKKIELDGHFIHPIVMDEKSSVVLDGMHRVEAIRQLGYPRIPACLVDYADPRIRLESWYRTVEGSCDYVEMQKVIEDLGYRVKKDSLNDARQLVTERKAYAAIFTRTDNCTIHGPDKNIRDTYYSIKEIETKIRGKGSSITYLTEEGAREAVFSNKSSAGLMTPTVTKAEVVSTALSGKVFPPKATRHVIPARPMFVNIPNEWLTTRFNLAEANHLLVNRLRSRGVRRLPPGQVLDRLYEEELYVFG
jgi:hypothetical protein